MVRLQIINLLPEQDGPQVFAKEFDHVEMVCEAWAVAREAGH